MIPELCSTSWIPDFQHIHLPQFFSDQEIRQRNDSFSRIAVTARSIVFSSRNAQRDFQMLYPESTAKTHILHFHTSVDNSLFSGDVKSIQQLYRLPTKFMICCNQFWKHKNHLLLFESLAALRDRGIFIPLICTGSTDDYRFADYFQQVRETIKRLQLSDQVQDSGNHPAKSPIAADSLCCRIGTAVALRRLEYRRRGRSGFRQTNAFIRSRSSS